MPNRRNLTRANAFSLIELMTVVAILAVLMAILVPIFASAKERAKTASDVSNLGQCAKALALYTADNDDWEPVLLEDFFGQKLPARPYRFTGGLKPYSGGGRVFLSRFDRPEGRSGLLIPNRVFPMSYYSTWLLWQGVSGNKAWTQLKQMDGNPIVFRSYWSDSRARAAMLASTSELGEFRNASSYVARKDTSVKIRKDADTFFPGDDSNATELDYERSYWHLASDETCPSVVCDGKSFQLEHGK